MGRYVDVVVTGELNLKAALDEFGSRKVRSLVKNALETVATEMVQDVREFVPVGHTEKDDAPGYLREAIGSKVLRAREGQIRLLVGPRSIHRGGGGEGKETMNPGVYGMFVEFGLKNKKNYPRQPYMRPAFDDNSEKWMATFRGAMTAQLNQGLKTPTADAESEDEE